MGVNSRNTDRLHLGGYGIDEVYKFSFLGCMASQDGGAKEMYQIEAKGAFAQLGPIWTPHQIHMRTKLIRVFKSNVISVLLYGYKTWKATQKSLTSYKLLLINVFATY
jgi:hypothetical protein